MESFPLTKNKLLLQPQARQHKLVAQWLKSLYLELIDTRFSPLQLKAFRKSYTRVLLWLNDSKIEWNEQMSKEEWTEFFADQYHYHKKLSGIGIAEHNLLPRVQKGDRIEDYEWNPKLNYKVALDNLRSAFNVGSIFRTTDATGLESVIIGGTTPGIENQQVVKTAMSCTEWIPQESALDLSTALNVHKENGYTIIGLETVDGSQTHWQFNWPEKGVVVLGNEEYGISQKVLQCCDSFVHLPMQGKKNSVNVANAFAVIAFQIAFNRKAGA